MSVLRVFRPFVVATLVCLLLHATRALAAETPPSILWNVTFGSGNYNDALGVAVGPDGRPVAVGQTCLPDFSDCSLRAIKFDSDDGTVLWTQTFASSVASNIDFATSVAIGADGHPVVAGSSCNSSLQACVIRVIKYDGVSGALIWNVTYDSAQSNDVAQGVAIGPDGSPIVTGASCSASLDACEIPLIKFNGETGAVVWDEFVASERGREIGFGIAVGAGGHAVVAAQSCLSSDLTDCDVRTLTFDGNGSGPIWNVVFDSGTDVQIGSEAGVDVSIGADGNPVVGGYSCFVATDCDVRALKYDGADGTILWNITFNSSGTNYDDLSGVSVGADGHPVVTGSRCPTQIANCDVVLMKLDGGTGATIWSATFAGPDSDQASSVAVGGDGNPYVTGFTCAAANACDIRTIRYRLQNGTPAGLDVTTSLNGGTSEPNGVAVTFGTVLVEGTTSVVTSPDGDPPPSGFSFIGAPPIYFDISTTAMVVAPIEVCINYSDLAFAGDETDIRIFHRELDMWVDHTTSLDTDANVICATVASLSPFAIGIPGNSLTSLGPASIWIGLKNSDDVGIRFDLRAEVYRDGTQLVGSGQINSAHGGSSGFSNARQNTIPIPASPTNFPSGSTISLKVLVRNACTGSGKNSGTARLWYNDAQANSRVQATFGSPTTYFLRDGFVLLTTPGSGPKKTIDVSAGSKCSPFKVFGTWTATIP